MYSIDYEAGLTSEALDRLEAIANGEESFGSNVLERDIHKMNQKLLPPVEIR